MLDYIRKTTVRPAHDHTETVKMNIWDHGGRRVKGFSRGQCPRRIGIINHEEIIIVRDHLER